MRTRGSTLQPAVVWLWTPSLTSLGSGGLRSAAMGRRRVGRRPRDGGRIAKAGQLLRVVPGAEAWLAVCLQRQTAGPTAFLTGAVQPRRAALDPPVRVRQPKLRRFVDCIALAVVDSQRMVGSGRQLPIACRKLA